MKCGDRSTRRACKVMVAAAGAAGLIRFASRAGAATVPWTNTAGGNFSDIANWNSGQAAKSLKFFAGHGHPQILAGYYDGDLGNFKHWDAAAKGVPGVTGFLYTTWQARYDQLEAFGKALLGKD